ncbi:hypothetical protein GN244_ATG01136 [Phytophthora infestans]|uniref:Uncharacterized protein n=1 Tax=Phytophthora infestans TaxID=4787 RepID=A0A833WQD3_PHYIN|nr:hypothetical protein GN244_ATG01136 [Phytophthora infestans]
MATFEQNAVSLTQAVSSSANFVSSSTPMGLEPHPRQCATRKRILQSRGLTAIFNVSLRSESSTTKAE